MKRKGFTLIELLAVIIVLAIIAVIAVSMVLNTIEKSKEGALQGSAYGIIEAATLYYARNSENPETKEFILKDGLFKAGEEVLKLKGEVKGTGNLIIDKQGVITLCINDDKRYAYKSYNTDRVSVGSGDTCKIEENILINKYVAYLTGEDGSSSLDSYYTKEEVDSAIEEARFFFYYKWNLLTKN